MTSSRGAGEQRAHQDRPNGAGGLMEPADWARTEGVVIPKKEFLMDYVSKLCDFAKMIFERLM